MGRPLMSNCPNLRRSAQIHRFVGLQKIEIGAKTLIGHHPHWTLVTPCEALWGGHPHWTGAFGSYQALRLCVTID